MDMTNTENHQEMTRGETENPSDRLRRTATKFAHKQRNENIQAKCLITLSAELLATMSMKKD